MASCRHAVMSLKLLEEFNGPNTYTDFALPVPLLKLWQPREGGIYSGQDLANLKDRDTYSTASKVPQTFNVSNTPVGSYRTPRRESRAQTRDTS